MKQKYRVTLPIDLTDGVVHQAGEIVELDLETATAYRHALIAVPQPKTEDK